MTIYLPVRHTLHKGQVHGPSVFAVVSLQFTYATLRGQTWERILLLLIFIA